MRLYQFHIAALCQFTSAGDKFAQGLIDEARGLYAHEPFGIDLAGSVYAFDASTIDLCLSLFPWAHFGRAKSAKASIKLHTLLDLRGNIPSFIHLFTGRIADVRGFDKLSLEAGAIYVMDRGYLDFTRLYRLHEASAFFVSRPKHNTQLQRSSSMPSNPAIRAANAAAGICSDQRIRLTGNGVHGGFFEQRIRRERIARFQHRNCQRQHRMGRALLDQPRD